MTTIDAPAPSAIRRTSVLARIAAILAILLAAFDIVGVLAYLDAPVPIVLNIAIVVLAVATVIGAVFTWRGTRWGAWLAAITRFLALVPTIPVLTNVDGVPLEAVIPTWIQVGVTAIVIVLLVIVAARKRIA